MFGIISPPTRTSFGRPKTKPVEPVKDATEERPKNTSEQQDPGGQDSRDALNQNERKAPEDASYSSINTAPKADSNHLTRDKSATQQPPAKSLDITA